VPPPGRRCRGEGDLSSGFLMTVAETWPSRRLGDGLRDLKSNFSPMCDSQAWVGARKPPLAVTSVVALGAGGAGGLPAVLLLPFLLLRPPLPAADAPNNMSAFFRVFSRTFPSATAAAEERRPAASFSLLLVAEDEPLDSVDALRWSLSAVAAAPPVPLVITFGFGLLVGERLRPPLPAAGPGSGFLIGDGFLTAGALTAEDAAASFEAAVGAAAPAEPGLAPPPPTARKSLMRPGDSSAFLAPSPAGLAPSEEMPFVAVTSGCSVSALSLSLLSPLTPFKFFIKFGDCRLADMFVTGPVAGLAFLLLVLLLLLLLFLFSLFAAAASGFLPPTADC
jgi:hypothetical protein